MKRNKFGFFLGLFFVLAFMGFPLAVIASIPSHQVLPFSHQKILVYAEHMALAKMQNASYRGAVAVVSEPIAKHSATLSDPSADPLHAIKVGGGGTLTINGFLNMAFFAQDQPYNPANGVFATFPAPVSPSQPNATNQRTITGGDLRNTRLMVSFSHSLKSGWTAGGFLSSDLEGGFANTSVIGTEQPNPRLRQMFITFAKGATSIKMGQFVTLSTVQFPYSLAHLAEPNGFFWANGIWWYPGVSVTRGYHLGRASKLELTGAVQEGSWPGSLSANNYESAGNAGFRPQWQGRAIYSSKTASGIPWMIFGDFSYEQIDLGGPFGAPPVPSNSPENSFHSYLLQAGASVTPGHFSIKGNLIYGQGMANQLLDFIQFGAIKFHGGWIQAGYHFSDHLGVYTGYYYNQPNASDVVAWRGHYLTGKAFTTTLAYDVGTYGVALEWMHNIQGYTNAGVDSIIIGNQLSLSAIYRF